MPLITVKQSTPSIPPGTYSADLVGIAPKRMVTQYSKNGEEQDFLEWTWLVHGKNSDAEINSLTTTATGAKSRINEYLTALLGADGVKIGLQLDEKDLVGKKVMLQITVNDDGFSKVERVIAHPDADKQGALAALKAEVAPKSDESAPAVAQTVSPLREEPEMDDLPF